MIICELVFIGCSQNKLPVSPAIRDSVFPIDNIEANADRDVLTVYDATIDPITKTFILSPSQRNADYHFPLTQLYPNVLQIVDYGFTPSFWADIKLTHPLPGSGIDAFDPRIIAILLRIRSEHELPGF